MAAGKLDTERVKEAAGILLEHKRSEMPGVSVAVAAGCWASRAPPSRRGAVLESVAGSARRRRHEVTIDSLVRVHALLDELRRLGRIRELRDYIWWSGQDAADYADGKLAQAWLSSAPGSSPRNTCHRRKISDGHAVSWPDRLEGSRADSRDGSDEAGGPADRDGGLTGKTATDVGKLACQYAPSRRGCEAQERQREERSGHRRSTRSSLSSASAIRRSSEAGVVRAGAPSGVSHPKQTPVAARGRHLLRVDVPTGVGGLRLAEMSPASGDAGQLSRRDACRAGGHVQLSAAARRCQPPVASCGRRPRKGRCAWLSDLCS